MNYEEIQAALADSSKESRRVIATLAAEIETQEPERYRAILSKTDWQGEALFAYNAYKRARVLSRILMILAVVVAIGSYLVGDFGLRLFTGWMGRYALAGGVLIALSLFAGGALLFQNRKERLIVYGIPEDHS